MRTAKQISAVADLQCLLLHHHLTPSSTEEGSPRNLPKDRNSEIPLLG